jgi:Cof subfamily protein (haloacid dehalogenase superfamily)
VKISLIVTDLDNTLLRRNKTVSDYTRNVFARCRERGVRVAFATARYFRTIEEWLSPQIGITPDITISLNGAYTYTLPERETLYSALIKPSVGNKLIHTLRECGCQLTVGTDAVRYTERPITPSHRSFSVAYDFSAPISQAFHYIDVHADPAWPMQWLDQYATIRVQRYNNETLMTIVHGNAHKHLALAAVIEQLDIAPSQVVVFGDDCNDMDMLSLPGVMSVAVENAVPEVKAVVAHVCGDCDEDGVAKWLDVNVL